MHLPPDETELPRSIEHPAARVLLDAYNAAWPGVPVDPAEVLAIQSGWLPTRRPDTDPRTGAPNLAARGRVRFITTEGGAPVIEAETVNFTLSRRTAERAVDRICEVVRREIPDSPTARTPLPKIGHAQPATLDALQAREEAAGGESGRYAEGTPAHPVPPLRSWLVDAHVHLHPRFDPTLVVRGLIRNLTRAAGERPEPVAGACLLLAATPAEPPLEALLEGGGIAPGLPAGWQARATAEAGSVRLEGEEGELPILLVDGAQLVTAEGLELLALCLPRERGRALAAERVSLAEGVTAVIEAGGFPVIPWGFGKWWGARGRTLADFLDDVRPGVLAARGGAPGSHGPLAPRDRDPANALALALGDNGNRLGGAPRPLLFARGEARGVPVLPGSDPLPLEGHADRVGSAGFVLTGPLDPDRPAASVAWTLGTLTGSPAPFGDFASPVAFVRDQIAMQRLKERAR